MTAGFALGALLYASCGGGSATPGLLSSTPTATAGTTPDDPTTPTDADQDGAFTPDDCDDADPTVFPGAFEITCDGRDNDCAGGDAATDCLLEAAEADYAIPTTWLDNTVVGDIDGFPGDDVIDTSFQVALLPNQTEGFTIYVNSASAAQSRFPVDGIPALTAGDATGDGQADLWVRSGTTAYLLAGPVKPGVSLERDAVARITGIEYTLGWRAFGNADVDGDGLADLVDGDGRICAGPAVGKRMDAATDCWGWPRYSNAYGNTPYSVMAGDLTGDGVPELVGTFGGDRLDLLTATQAGLVAEPTTTIRGKHKTTAAAAAPGDVDGDGYDDLLVSACKLEDGKVLEAEVDLLRGPLAGELTAEGDSAATLTAAFRVYVLGDLDEDGVPEIAASTAVDGVSNIARVPLAGSFDLADVGIPVPGSRYMKQYLPDADLDADGRTDFVARADTTLLFTTLAEVRP